MLMTLLYSATIFLFISINILAKMSASEWSVIFKNFLLKIAEMDHCPYYKYLFFHAPLIKLHGVRENYDNMVF